MDRSEVIVNTVDLHLIPWFRVGTHLVPMITHVARSVIEVRDGWSETVEVTLTGPVCGMCVDGYGVLDEGGAARPVVRHASVEHVRLCVSLQAEHEAENRAEAALDHLEAQYWDNGGPYSEVIVWEAEQDRLRAGS